MIIVEIAGFLGADAEERFTANGKRVVSLRLATKVRQGGKDETVWWKVNIWGDRFDRMLPYLKKGTPLIVVGEMAKPETYTSKDGSQQVSLSLTAEIIRFSPFGKSERGEGGANTSQQTSGEAYAPAQAKEEFAAYGASNESAAFAGEDLPF